MRERELFIEALELADSTERWVRLEADCAGDEALRRRVLQLIEEHEKPESFFLDSPPLVAAFPNMGIPAEGPGTVVGSYKLLEVIGEGGMGVVYLAEQTEPVRRKVALKVIKPGMDTRQVIARFEAERQALALMEHPNIARVLDAGTTGTVGRRLTGYGGSSESPAEVLAHGRSAGRPYFVMELVRGLPITEYCDQRSSSVQERLELFVHVCQAVQHAHQKGIIHRDIKPSNVLVTEHDGEAVVKVIDFGVAKAVGPRLTEQTLSTGFAQWIGTPLYMSPEQADVSGLDVDTRSDIYSLGVLLYELLTGTTPFSKERLKTAGFDEIRRIIREEEPPRPSLRMCAVDPAVTTASQRRGSDPRELRRLLQGELDWIVTKALEKDRNRRYDTASELALDVQRYLRDEPVRACPPSAVYRVRKLAWRNRLPLAITGVGMAVLMLAVLGLTIGLVAVDRERTEAMRQRDDAQTQRRLARRAVDTMYTQVAEKWLSQQPYLEAIQREFLEEALRYYQEFGEERVADPELRLATGNAYRRIGQIQDKLGDLDRAEDAVTRAIGLLRALAADLPREPRYREALANSRHTLGCILYRHHRFEPAGREFQESLLLYEALLAQNPNLSDSVTGPAFSHAGLASVWLGQGRAREAVDRYRQALSLLQALPPDVASRAECRRSRAHCTLNLGWALANDGRPREAEASCREAVLLHQQDVKDFPRDPSARHDLAWSYWTLQAQLPDRFSPEAEALLRKAFAIEAALQDEYPSAIVYQHVAALCQTSLSEWLRQHGRHGESVEASRQAFAQYEKLVGQCSSLPTYGLELMQTWLVVRPSLLESGRFDETEKALRKTQDLAERLRADFPRLDPFRHLVALCQHTRGIILGELSRPREAETGFREAIATWADLLRTNPAQHEYRSWLAWCHNDLADLFATCPVESFRDSAQAVHLARKAVELEPDHAGFWNTLGIALYRAGDSPAAVRDLEKSMTMNNGGDCYDWFFLAMAHHQLNHEEKARQFYERATSWLEQNQSALEKNRLQAARFRRFHAEAKHLLEPRGDSRSEP